MNLLAIVNHHQNKDQQNNVTEYTVYLNNGVFCLFNNDTTSVGNTPYSNEIKINTLIYKYITYLRDNITIEFHN